MDEQQNNVTRPVNPRRRKRSQMQIFKEAYLPVIIAGIAVLLIIVFIIGSISRSIEQKRLAEEASIAASASALAEFNRLTAEADQLIAESELYAAQYDYDGAIDVLDRFSGDMSQFSAIADKRAEYVTEKGKLTAWSDPADVINLSFQLLIADTQRAFSDETYGTAYNRNFVTTEEFSKILQQLYENGYMLVSLDDFITTQTDETGNEIYAAKTMYLPKGKKPLVITQTNVNYNNYMIDSDADKVPDKDGDGFASRLVIGDDGKFTCEMVDSTGTTVTGAFDLVPILESFIETHPDFSYKGAKAILAVTGYDGLFGYRTNPEAEDRLGKDAYAAEVAGATAIIDALRSSGYEIACYTYENLAYGESSETEIQADLDSWSSEVLPILGDADIFVFAQSSDISDSSTPYSGGAYNLLKQNGFRYYLGFCIDRAPWISLANDHVRQGRILVTGSNMAHHADWFSGLFDPASVLDSSRGDIPS